jgi:hypothetical protein
VLWLAELQPLTAAQHCFRMQYGRQPPTWKSIRFWDDKLRSTGSLLYIKSRTSEENVSHNRKAFQRSPCKSILAASLQLPISHSAVHNVLHKRLCLRAYKIQMICALKPSDQITCTNFAVDMLERIDATPDFLRQVCFSDNAMFHVSGVVSRYNCRIWGSQNPHVTCELERDSPKVTCGPA